MAGDCFGIKPEGENNGKKTRKLVDSAPHRSLDSGQFLTNSNIAELLATQSETAPTPFPKALRRPSRRAFLDRILNFPTLMSCLAE